MDFTDLICGGIFCLVFLGGGYPGQRSVSLLDRSGKESCG